MLKSIIRQKNIIITYYDYIAPHLHESESYNEEKGLLNLCMQKV